MDRELSPKHQAFVEAYLETWNASEAARRAGYNGKSNVAGPRLLANDSIQAAISKRLDELAMPANEVVGRLGEHARGDMGVFFKLTDEWTEFPLPSQEIIGAEQRVDPDDEDKVKTIYLVRRVTIDLERVMDPRYSRLIKRFTDSPRNGLTLELYDAQAALEKLGKAHGLFVERINLSGQVGIKGYVQVSPDDWDDDTSETDSDI